MIKGKIKEQQYLDAKIGYYSGKPIMSNEEFDALENELKLVGSKVVNQVGSKISDYDYPLPNRMGSLDKIQTVAEEYTYSYALFREWWVKMSTEVVSARGSHLECTPKYDGNSVDVIFVDGKLFKIITRGDGLYGKDVTVKISHRVKFDFLNEIPKTGVVEVRCEAIMLQATFDDKYSHKYANSRNMIAGMLGRDDLSIEDANDIDLIPLRVLHNGVDAEIELGTYMYKLIGLGEESYIKMFEHFIDFRSKYEYQLDGVVISYPKNLREEMGEGETNPKWSIAIKFVPDAKDTTIESIDWQIGKTGELTPVANITPIHLAGTTVSRVTCFNYGFIEENRICVGTKVTVCKRGDIIPHIEEVFYNEDYIEPTPKHCPYCGSILEIDGIHLMCSNKKLCNGVILCKLVDSVKLLDFKNVGSATLSFISHISGVHNGLDLLIYANSVKSKPIMLGFEETHVKSYKNFVSNVERITSLSMAQCIMLLCFDGIGPKVSLQLAKEISGYTPDFKGIDSTFTTHDFLTELKNTINVYKPRLEEYGIEIIPYEEEVDEEGTVYVEMTGSPKEFGFKTKNDWISQFGGKVKTVSLSDSKCQYLITDDLSSTSSKMKSANKKGVKIVTYSHKF